MLWLSEIVRSELGTLLTIFGKCPLLLTAVWSLTISAELTLICSLPFDVGEGNDGNNFIISQWSYIKGCFNTMMDCGSNYSYELQAI